jgi:hypothetical protein
MRTLIFILSATAILFLTTCDEENPTGPNYSNGIRSIWLYSLNNNAFSKIQDVGGPVYDCIYVDSTFFIYGTYHGSLAELSISNIFKYSYYGNRIYFNSATLESIRAYPESKNIFLSDNDNIYLVEDYGNQVSNLTPNFLKFYGSPVFIPNQNLLLYGNALLGENNGGKIFSQNLETGTIDTLVKEQFAIILPVFITEDGSHLIYTSDDFQNYTYSIKSANLYDLQDIKVLTSGIRVTHFGKNKSINDKIAFSSDRTVYVLNLNTADLKAVTSSGQFADISIDGEKVVFTNLYDLYLINSDGTNLKRLISKFPENKYLFLPSFSSNGEQLVYVESDYPFGYQNPNYY